MGCTDGGESNDKADPAAIRKAFSRSQRLGLTQSCPLPHLGGKNRSKVAVPLRQESVVFRHLALEEA